MRSCEYSAIQSDMNPSTFEHDVACVTVFYNPEPGALDSVETLVRSGYPVVVVVNQASAAQIEMLSALPNVHLIRNAANRGLATALNQGLGFAFEQLGARYALALDQDSVPNPAMPKALARELEACCGERIACLGPRLLDRKSVRANYVYDQSAEHRFVPRTIPTSGTLFPQDAWRQVGPMLAPLFIDGIDHEWCFRAYERGFHVAVSPQATMLHDMGDTGIRVFGRFKPIHRSPIRHYFIIRNTLYLCSLSYVPKGWKVSELFKTVRRMAVYLLVSTDRGLSARLICRAIQDGIAGRLGPCPI